MLISAKSITKEMKMWRDLSSTQVHQSLNPYQQYPPSPNQTNGNGVTAGANKWNAPAGQRSSYSLPHPGHAQSNMRWQKPELNNQLSSSTRNLTHNPSFLHPSSDNRVTIGQRQRPASMYDTPSSMGFHQNGSLPNRNIPGSVPPSRNGSLRQNPGELVSSKFFLLHLFLKVSYCDEV